MNAVPIELVQRLHSIVGGILGRHGFLSTIHDGVYCRQRDERLFDRIWILTDLKDASQAIVVTANLSVRCHRPEATIPGESAPETSLTCNIGYLTPRAQWQEWRLHSLNDAERVASEIADTIVHFGIPWLERLDDAASVCRERNCKQPTGFHGLKRVGRKNVLTSRSASSTISAESVTDNHNSVHNSVTSSGRKLG